MRLKNESQPINPFVILMLVYLLGLVLLCFSSCNPVKQVLKDKAKLDKVAEVVIRSGYCANDTSIIVKSDTLVQTDTITNTEMEVIVKDDTVFKTIFKDRVVKKTLTIRDTIQKIVLDNARINALQSDNRVLSMQLEDSKHESRKRLHWLLIALLVIIGYIFLKFYRSKILFP